VRDDDDPSTARAQAEAFRRRYPDWHRFGLSAYYAEDDDAVDDLAADLLERFPILRIYDPAALSAGGIEVVPTFRAPHVTPRVPRTRRRAAGARNRASRAPGEPLP
jgi:hypothetical protein